MKRGLRLFLVSIFIFLILTTFVSAFSFSKFFNEFAGKITGNTITGRAVTITCSDSDSGNDPFNLGQLSDGQKTFYDYCAEEGSNPLPVSGYTSDPKLEVYSLSFWVKPSSYGNAAIASSSNTGSDASTWGMIFRNNGNVEVWVSDGTKGQQAIVANDWNSVGFPSTSWTHVVAVVDGTSIKYYKNGILVNEIKQTIRNVGTAYRFSVGSLGEYNGFYLDGKISSFSIFGYALTPAEVSNLYNTPFEDSLIELSCDPSNSKIIHATPTNCPLGCKNGACIPADDEENETEEETNITCEDSDGTNIYTFGYVNWSDSTGELNYNSDGCTPDGKSVIEMVCSSDDLFNSSIFPCVSGVCQYGACLKNASTTSNETEIEFGEEYFLELGQTIFVDNKFSEEDISITALYIGEDKVSIKLGPETLDLNENQKYLLVDGDYRISMLVTDIFNSVKDTLTDSFVFHLLIEKVEPFSDSCEDVLSFMKYPTNLELESGSWELLDNNYFENSENQTGYYASWRYLNSEYSSEYGYASLVVSKLANKEIIQNTLNNYLDYNLCSKQKIYLEDSETPQTVYVCKNLYSLIRESDKPSSLEFKNEIEIIWFNDENNQMFEMYFYGRSSFNECYDEESCDDIVQYMQLKNQESLIGSIDSLINNYGEWESPSLDYLSESFIKYFLTKCYSSVLSGDSSSWNCKQEPIICPPHGEQKYTCTRYNDELGKEESKERILYCSPGICSGCIVPRWFESVSENNCIEYGFRFKQQTAWDLEDVFTEYNSSEGLSVEQADIYPEIELVVYSNNTALLSLRFDEEGNVTEFYLEEGKSYPWDFANNYDGFNYTLYVDGINYNEENYSQSNIQVTLKAQGFEQKVTPKFMNMYCDLDGEIKEQKINAGEECQNNYECYSNLCSYGECVGLKEMVQEIKGFKAFFTKLFCKVSHLANEEAYFQCVTDNS